MSKDRSEKEGVSILKLKMIREGTVEYASAGEPITSPSKVAALIGKYLEDEASECLVVVMLDTKNHPIGIHEVSRGGLNFAAAHPREVFRAALVAGAASIILGHNHPTGNVTPSANDKTLTIELKKAGELLGVSVLDHVIVGLGTDKYTSLKEQDVI